MKQKLVVAAILLSGFVAYAKALKNLGRMSVIIERLRSARRKIDFSIATREYFISVSSLDSKQSV